MIMAITIVFVKHLLGARHHSQETKHSVFHLLIKLYKIDYYYLYINEETEAQ